MQLSGLLAALTETVHFRTVLDQIRRQEPILDQNILRSARPFVAAGIAQALPCPILVVTAQPDRAYNLTQQLPVWLPQAQISRFAEPKAAFYERIPWSDDTIRARLETLALLLNWEAGSQPPIIVTSAPALMQKTLPVREFRLGSRKLRVGQTYEPDKLVKLWLELGYEPVAIVSQPGQFSRRGGILDIFPSTAHKPVRIDFFDTDIESLRHFEPATQRSLDSLESVSFAPTREAIPKYAPRAAQRLEAWFAGQPPGDKTISVLSDFEALQLGTGFPLLEYYLPWLYDNPASLLDYLPENTLVLVDDWHNLRDGMAEQEENALQRREEKIQQNALPADAPLPYHTWDELHDHLLSLKPIHLGRGEHQTADEVIGDLFQSGSRFGGQIRHVLEHLHGLYQQGEQAITVTRQAEHLASLWGESHSHIAPVETIDNLADTGFINFVQGELGEGWVLHDEQGKQLHLLTDAEIFGWKRPEPRRRQRPKTTTPEALFADLEIGDFVVHIEHGIGRFAGLIRREFKGEERELLQLEYGENDVLYVPIHQADRLTRYVGTDDEPPKLNRLGTQEWSKARQKATQAAEELAQELLNLYAARELAVGHAFSPDTPWQHELEASFPYVETEDQLVALRAVKADMEAPRPMDRLICGDVGYGKTEIALRAAFKAVMDGKQVAILVPTTILANQHYHTFSERLAVFPVKVEMLSRFRTEDEQNAILKKLANGEIDIMIGTHRLLSKDVRFKELGLVVIDEEQRFGMTQKEQLKLLRNELDVLTLTATPIPRTLYMGMMGLRDVSLINTAPDERLPVLTHVGMYDPKLVRHAILRELDRGGQVFFVHNRVQSIDGIADKLRDLVPEAKIMVGHSQMSNTLLEKIMSNFATGETDVLVSTAIIESGLDIPNANTIIVDRADWFGLASLYQLRGRVGRSANQGYAYFFHPSTNRLTEETKSRLEVIAEETQLGAGYSIAIRDLEVRGAGELLGKKQSGHIALVGFHLYTQLLAQAVQKLKRKEKDHKFIQIHAPLTIDLPLPTYIPREYIPETSLRIQLYRRLADLTSTEAIEEMQVELADRFGEIPRAVAGLLYQLRVKILAAQAHASAILHDSEKIGIRLPYLGKIDRYQLQTYLGASVRVSRDAIWLNRAAETDEWQLDLLGLLEKLQVAPTMEMHETQTGL